VIDAHVFDPEGVTVHEAVEGFEDAAAAEAAEHGDTFWTYPPTE
jgi:hypothetical protein